MIVAGGVSKSYATESRYSIASVLDTEQSKNQLYLIVKSIQYHNVSKNKLIKWKFTKWLITQFKAVLNIGTAKFIITNEETFIRYILLIRLLLYNLSNKISWTISLPTSTEHCCSAMIEAVLNQNLYIKAKTSMSLFIFNLSWDCWYKEIKSILYSVSSHRWEISKI